MLALPSLNKSARSGFLWGEYKEFDNHEFVIEISDAASGLKGFIAVHNRNRGIAHGGTRMRQYADDRAALKDVLNLSRAMSYKSALAGLPYGGAKAVIIEQPQADRQAVLAAFAEKVQGLGGLFHTGTDVGLTDDDVRYMAGISNYMLGVGTEDTHGFSTAKSAALGVYYSIKTAAKHVYGKDDLNGVRVGIKGVGKLGGDLAEMLARDGAHLLVADTSTERTAALQRLPNIQVVGSDEIRYLPMDIYAPCAFGNEFTKADIRKLQCKIIAGGANNQLVNPSVGDEMYKRGIIYIPDYIANAGGLIFVSEELELDGFHIDRLQTRLSGIADTCRMILERSDAERLPTHRVADKIAEERIYRGKA